MHFVGNATSVKRVVVLGAASAGFAAAIGSFGTGTASAEVTETAPQPYVTSRQAVVVSEDALRVVDVGEARGFGETRNGGIGEVHAQGPGVQNDTVMAIPGSYAAPFYLQRPGSVNDAQQRAAGQFTYSPPIGTFGGSN